MEKKKKKQAFTIMETIIVMVLLGIIATIVMPSALNTKPDTNLVKFQKAHLTFLKAIEEIINDDTLYLEGDLGVRPNGTLINANTTTTDAKYLCESLAKKLSTKQANCSTFYTEAKCKTCFVHEVDGIYKGTYTNASGATVTNPKIGVKLDDHCKLTTTYGNFKKEAQEIILPDGTLIYEIAPLTTFGINMENSTQRMFSDNTVYSKTDTTFANTYKEFCIDIDGVVNSNSVNCDDNTDVCPFGYGVRADGRIITGERAQQWLAKKKV